MWIYHTFASEYLNLFPLNRTTHMKKYFLLINHIFLIETVILENDRFLLSPNLMKKLEYQLGLFS